MDLKELKAVIRMLESIIEIAQEENPEDPIETLTVNVSDLGKLANKYKKEFRLKGG